MSPRHLTLRRRTRSSTERASLDALVDEQEFVRQSIDDLEVERALGDVGDEDFAALSARYGRRLAEIETAIAALATPGQTRTEGDPRDAWGPELSEVRSGGRQSVSSGGWLRRWLGRRRVRLVIGIAAAGCFVAGAALLAVSLAGVRLPGESATGSVTLSSAQQEQETLERAAILGSEGQVAEAVQLYNQVLQADPTQPDALAYGGWLVRLAGLASKNRLVLARGDASVARAVKVAPGYPDGHALLGVILYEDFGRPAAASAQFRDALDTGASKSLISSVAQIAAKAFAASRQPLPPSYLAAMRSTAAAGAAG